MLAVSVSGWDDVLALIGLAALLGAGLLVVVIGWVVGRQALRDAIRQARRKPDPDNPANNEDRQ